jgi:hypothetical protein
MAGFGWPPRPHLEITFPDLERAFLCCAVPPQKVLPSHRKSLENALYDVPRNPLNSADILAVSVKSSHGTPVFFFRFHMVCRSRPHLALEVDFIPPGFQHFARTRCRQDEKLERETTAHVHRLRLERDRSRELAGKSKYRNHKNADIFHCNRILSLVRVFVLIRAP